MKEFAATTPLQLGDLAKGAQTMLGFNVAAEEIMPMLQAIGDISMGDAQKFQSLTLAFSQMQSVGKLMGQDLLQMINAGFNPLMVISDQTGKSIATLKEQMSQGAITAEAVTKAFINATKEGGKFHGMLASQGDTVKGSIAQLQGTLTDMFNGIGEQSEGIIKGTVQSIQWLVQHYKQIGTVLAGIIATYGTYKAVMIATVALERLQLQINLAKMSGLTQWGALLEILKAKQLALNKAVLANPYILLATALVGTFYSIYKLATAENAAETAQRKHNAAMAEGKKQLDNYKQAVSDYLAIVRDDTATQLQRYQAYEKLQRLLHQLKGKTLDEVSKMATGDIDKIKNQNADTKQLKQLKRATEEAKKAVEQAERALELTKASSNSLDNRGYFQALYSDSRRLEENKEALRLAREELKTYEELQNRAQWEAKPHAEKVAYLTQQKKLAEEQKALYAEQLPPQVRQLALQGKITEAMRVAREQYSGIYWFLSANITKTGQWVHTIDRLNTKLSNLKTSTPQSYTDAYAKAQQAYKKAQQALQNAKKGTLTEYTKAKEDLQNAKDALEALGGNTSPKQHHEKEKELAETRKRQRQLQESRDTFRREQLRKEVDNAFALSQARLDASKDGLDKELKLARLHTDRLREENKRREEDWIATLHRQRTEEWELQHPKEVEQGHTYTATTTRKDLTKAQIDQLNEYERIATEAQLTAETEALKKRLQAYETYTDRRKRIIAEFQKAEAELYTTAPDGTAQLRNGVTTGNIEELDRQRQRALEDVDRTFAERQEAYQSWLDCVAQMSLAKLEEELIRITALLHTAENSTADDATLARLRTQIKTITKDIQKARHEAQSTKQTFENWSRLTESLRSTHKEIEGIAGELETFSQPLANAVRGVASLSAPVISVIGSIGKFAQLTEEGISSTATATQKAIATAEKGTVILAIISASLQVITKIIELFNNDKQIDKNITAINNQISTLQWRITHLGFEELEESAHNPLEHLNTMLDKARRDTIALALATGNVNMLYKTLEDKTIGIEKASIDLANAYAQAGYMADKAFGSERYTRTRKELELLAQQILLIRREQELEQSKKKSDKEKIADYERQVKELAEKMAHTIDDIFTDLLGGDAFAIADKLGNALFEAFSKGEDAARAFGNTVDDIIRHMVKKLLIQQFLETPIRDAINKLKQQATQDGVLNMEEFYSLIPTLQNELNKLGAQAKNMPNILDSILKGLGIDPEDTRQADRKGIATASQDSVNELNGRATAIQTHTANIAEGTRKLTSFAEDTLRYVADIARLVKEGNVSRQRIEIYTNNIASKIRDLDTYGVKIKR